jgi:competence protein ComK
MESIQVLNDYIIHEYTMGILPYYSDHGELYSIVLEQYRVVKVALSPIKIMNDSCIFYGSDMDGRKASAHSIFAGKKMMPVLVSEKYKLCMIPVCSPYKPKCVWIAYQHVLDVIDDNGQALILFTNHNKAKVELTKRTLQTKLGVAARLVSTYDLRYERIIAGSRRSSVAEETTLYKIDPEKFRE